MDKLAVVKQSLKSNPDVVIGKVETIYNTNSKMNIEYPSSVFFWVAPKGGLYTASELQEFMEELVPVPELAPLITPMHLVDGVLNFGHLEFAENIGVVKTSQSISYDGISSLVKFNGEKLKKNKSEDMCLLEENSLELTLKILVNPLPDINYLKDSFNSNNRIEHECYTSFPMHDRAEVYKLNNYKARISGPITD